MEKTKVMKNSIRTKSIFAGILMTITIAALGLAYGSRHVASQIEGRGRLTGAWNVSVSVRNCQTGAEIRTFESIERFEPSGTMEDISSGFPPSQNTAGSGVWSHGGDRNYEFRFKAYRFDPSGTFLGWNVISHTLELNEKADSFTSQGTTEVYNAAGILVFTGCSVNSGTRF